MHGKWFEAISASAAVNALLLSKNFNLAIHDPIMTLDIVFPIFAHDVILWQMKRREADFSTRFNKWAFYRWPDDRPAYFEHKVSRTLRLPFSAVSMKQNANLQIRKFVHKFSDFDRMGTPFDSVCFCGRGYVCIQYWRPGNKEFFVIPIDIFLKEKETSTNKGIMSLSESRARAIAEVYFFP